MILVYLKYVGREHANHLLVTLKETYYLEEDPESSKYVGMCLEWDYVKVQVHLSMPGYVAEALRQFMHTLTSKPDDQPCAHITPSCGA